jgi:hypothetical protein
LERFDVVQRRRPLILLLALGAAHGGFVLIENLSARVLPTVLLLLAASVTLWLGVGWLRRVPLTKTTVIGGAILLRLLLLPLPPTLSDDVLRYVWDGEVAAAGFNPYRLAPGDPELAQLRDEQWDRLPHKDVATVYPPLAVAVFALASRLPEPILALKTIFSAADICTCWLLLSIAERRRAPRARVLLYAWNPLAVLEIAGMGHVDSLGILAVVAAVYLLTLPQPQSLPLVIVATAAVLAKIVPLVAWPAWARRSRRPLVFMLTGAGLLCVALIPVAVATGGVPPGLLRFGISWEFNGPLYEPLWRVLEQVDLRGFIERVLDAAKSLTGWHESVNRLYPFNYPQFVAKVVLFGVSVPFFLRAWRISDPVQATGRVFSLLLLFSATVYPWYTLWMVPWAALERRWSWLLLAGTIPMSYLPQFLDVDLFPLVFCAIWIPFLVVLLMERSWSGR